MSGAAAMLLAALAALPAPAAPAASPSYDLRVDPRWELLGVVERLAGVGRADAPPAYAAAADARFARFKDHPAVSLVRRLATDPARGELLLVLPMYYSDPPELSLRERDADVHYLGDAAARSQAQRLIWELRDFARASEFSAFFRESRPVYEAAERAALADLRGVDAVRALEAELGLSLATRAHYVLPLLAGGIQAFISPYPLPPANLGAKTFEAYSISTEDPLAFAFSEPIYPFIDPSFYYFERLNVPDPEAFYGPELARCRLENPNCVKELLAAVVIGRVKRRLGLRYRWDRQGAKARYFPALEKRLDDYDAGRKRYPTLWTFYPRLFSVFYELAHDGRAPPAPLTVPARPRLRSAAAFFDPAVVARLDPRAAARPAPDPGGASPGAASPKAEVAPSLAPVRETCSVDARVELLSAALAASSPPRGGGAYARAARAAFGGLGREPAARRLAALRAAGAGAAELARLALLASPLPELALPQDAPASALSVAGGEANARALMSSLRAFARRSRFQRFWKLQEPERRSLEERARLEAAGAVSPAAAAAYAGEPAPAELRFVLAPLLPPGAAAEIGVPGGPPSFLRPPLQSPGAGFGLDALETSPAADWLSSLPWLAPNPDSRRTLARAVLLRVVAADLGERVYLEELAALPAARRREVEALAEALRAYEAAPAGGLRAFAPRLAAASAATDAPQAQRRAEERRAFAIRLAAYPGDAAALRQAARLDVEAEDYARARPELAALARLFPGDGTLRLELARAAARTGDQGLAAEEARAAAALPLDRPSRRRLALLFQELRDYPHAVEVLQALDAEKREASVLADLGLNLSLAGRDEKAAEALKMSVALDSAPAGPYLTLAAVCHALGRAEDERAALAAAQARGAR